jgi:Tfp pilus assembly protein PilN
MVDRIEINLLPAEYRVHHRTIRVPRWVFYPLLGLALLGAWLSLWSMVLDAQVSALGKESSDLDVKIQENRHIEHEINELKADRRQVVQKIQALERISVNRARWVRLLEVLSQNMPGYTWLVSIDEKDSAAPVLSIEGRTFSFPDVAEYMAKLKGSPYVLGVDLADIEQIAGNDRLYKFNIAVATNPNVGIAADEDTTAVLKRPVSLSQKGSRQ